MEDIIRDLAAHGADVNARVGDGGGNNGGDGQTPLLFAAGTPGRSNVVALLRWELCADPSLTSLQSR